MMLRDFPRGPVVKAPSPNAGGPGADPWSGNWVPHTATKIKECRGCGLLPQISLMLCIDVPEFGNREIMI